MTDINNSEATSTTHHPLGAPKPDDIAKFWGLAKSFQWWIGVNHTEKKENPIFSLESLHVEEFLFS